MKIALTKPYNFEGKEYTELEIDFESLTGRQVSQAKREFIRSGNFAGGNIMQADMDFCVYLRPRPLISRLSLWKACPPRTT